MYRVAGLAVFLHDDGPLKVAADDVGGGNIGGTLLDTIQIDVSSGTELRIIHAPGTADANLLLYGEEAFQGGVGDVIRVQNGQHIGHAIAVVCT